VSNVHFNTYEQHNLIAMCAYGKFLKDSRDLSNVEFVVV